MNALIRRYRVGAGSIDDLMRQVTRRFASQVGSAAGRVDADVPVPVGIVSYQAIAAGDSVVTVTVFDTAEQCRLAQDAAERIRLSLAEFEVSEVDTFTGEVLVNRASPALLDPVGR